MGSSATTGTGVSFADLLAASPVILGEGAVIERLRRSEGIRLDEHVVNSALIYQEAGRVGTGDHLPPVSGYRPALRPAAAAVHPHLARRPGAHRGGRTGRP